MKKITGILSIAGCLMGLVALSLAIYSYQPMVVTPLGYALIAFYILSCLGGIYYVLATRFGSKR